MWVAVHELPDRTLCAKKSSPGACDEPRHAGHENSSLIAQVCERLALKDHVVLIINSACQG